MVWRETPQFIRPRRHTVDGRMINHRIKLIVLDPGQNCPVCHRCSFVIMNIQYLYASRNAILWVNIEINKSVPLNKFTLENVKFRNINIDVNLVIDNHRSHFLFIIYSQSTLSYEWMLWFQSLLYSLPMQLLYSRRCSTLDHGMSKLPHFKKLLYAFSAQGHY